MNIEIANRLVQLRKSNNLSQEALAEKLGISRQAVSKWERAEASPDTDNLILLARLYKVSLDELLRTEDEIPMPEAEDAPGGQVQTAGTEMIAGDVTMSQGGGSVGGENYSTWGAENATGTKTSYRESGSSAESDFQEDDEEESDKGFSYYSIPVASIITVIYFIIGVTYGAWHPGWILFLLIPIWWSLVSAIRSGNAFNFSYPVLATLIYLCAGCFWGAWHPGWIIFLTIPLYYPMVSYIRSLNRRRKRQETDSFYYNRKDGGNE